MITTRKRGGLQWPTGHGRLMVYQVRHQSALGSAGFGSLIRWDQYGYYLRLPGQGYGLLFAMLVARHAATQGWVPIAAVIYSVTHRCLRCHRRLTMVAHHIWMASQPNNHQRWSAHGLYRTA